MEFVVGIGMYDQGTAHIADLIQPYLEALSKRLSADYGGEMQHLWVDLELSPGTADFRPPFTFRFQKRVSGRGRLTGLKFPDFHNVGQYSVRPDFFSLATIPEKEVPCHLMRLIYDSTDVLERKRAKLDGFDATLFRADFRKAILEYGCAWN